MNEMTPHLSGRKVGRKPYADSETSLGVGGPCGAVGPGLVCLTASTGLR